MFYLFSDESLEGVKPALGDRTSWESKGLDSGGGGGGTYSSMDKGFEGEQVSAHRWIPT